jgi:hypothetical protein
MLFLFQLLLKPTHGEGRPKRFSPNNELVGRGMGGSQPGEGGLGHPCLCTWDGTQEPLLYH